ncbi:hypothetical protein H0H93_000148 [Arthromyces matolae]|nr:hypothetical protein H0H93_000148 [Arthromyces matolae]
MPVDVVPDILMTKQPPFSLESYNESSLAQNTLDAFIRTAPNNFLGLAATYGSKCSLTSLTIFNGLTALQIRFSSQARATKRKKASRSLIQAVLSSQHKKLTFHMDRLAAALYMDVHLYIKHGVDLLSLSVDTRSSLAAFESVLRDQTMLRLPRVAQLFEQEEHGSSRPEDAALRAYLAYQVPLQCATPQIHTRSLNSKDLEFIVKIIRDRARCIALKPAHQKNDIESTYSNQRGQLQLASSRFQTRIKANMKGTRVIEIRTDTNKCITAKIKSVRGRAANLELDKHLSGPIKSVTTIGRDPPTQAEEARTKIALDALTQQSRVIENPFVSHMWFPSRKLFWDKAPPCLPSVPIDVLEGVTLNTSQTRAVRTILSAKDKHRITMIHGPPGTGKTTVIAAAVKSIISSDPRRTVWVVAHSNVAVKNVAEKLAKVRFSEFKILVSKDFHFDWHEHLYVNVEENVIRSDSVPEDIVSAEILLGKARVVLCTLSMLSAQAIAVILRIVPPQLIIVDEASQIEVGDYLPPLQRFATTLAKLVFIGDDKQLAPYGHSDIPELRSIFEMPHLRKKAILLDTQYRMPIPIGNFISKEVYCNRLKSDHKIKTWDSCSFVDVANGKEQKSGKSLMHDFPQNLQEIPIVIKVASSLRAHGKSFKIITPYDSQRSRLETALKDSKVPWEDTCFNVDSFQGNEADYIILSVVRSEKIGFLNDERRTNVMLTRCKRSLIIVTNRRFVEEVASSTLIGKLAIDSGSRWIQAQSVVNGNFIVYT